MVLFGFLSFKHQTQNDAKCASSFHRIIKITLYKLTHKFLLSEQNAADAHNKWMKQKERRRISFVSKKVKTTFLCDLEKKRLALIVNFVDNFSLFVSMSKPLFRILSALFVSNWPANETVGTTNWLLKVLCAIHYIFRSVFSLCCVCSHRKAALLKSLVFGLVGSWNTVDYR